MEVAVLGGGYAGVRLARELDRRLPRDVDLVIVDDTGDHLVQHELHRLIRFPELDEQVRIPLDDLVGDVTVVEESVTSVDEETRVVDLASGESLQPDILAICLGAVTGLDIIPGIDEYGLPLKRVEHAEAIRRRFEALGAGQRVLIGGAGLSGIQVAGELAAALERDGPDIEITVLEQESHVAPRFPNAFRAAVSEALADAGVVVRTGVRIERVDGTGAELEGGEVLPAALVIWTGGIAGPDATDNRRLRVRSDLRVADRTFALGDAALVVDDHGKRVPAAAQTAVRQAPVAAENIQRLVAAEEDHDLVFDPRLERHVHQSPGWVVSIGDDAVAMVGNEVVRGRKARAIKASVNAQYLGSIGDIQRALDAVREVIGPGRPREA